MTRTRTIFLACFVASSGVAHAQTLGPREQLILRSLDADEDQRISCPELAAFLNPAIQTLLREMGIEPRSAKSVPPCGSRQAPGPAPNDADGRSADENYEEYFRELIQGALGAANSVPNTDDWVAPGEIGELEGKSFDPPLTGTLADVLPDSPDTPTRDDGKAWTDVLEDWVNIRQSFLDEKGIGKPAKITFTDYADDDETLDTGDARRVYAVQTAIVLTPPFVFEATDYLEFSPVFAFEMNLSSDKPESDLIVHRFGFTSMFVRKDSTAPFSSHLFDVTFDFSTNRGYEASVVGATAQWTPQYRAIGIGQYLRRGATLDFRWRPYVGVVWNDVRNADVVQAYQEQTSFTHWYTKLAGELKITDRVKVTPEWTIWRGDRQVSEDVIERWQSHGTLETRLVMSQSRGVDRASLTFTLNWGRNSPAFQNEHSRVVSLAVKF